MRVVLVRVLSVVPTVIVATLIVFCLMHLVPGDPAVAAAGDYASDEQIATVREQLGLNRPLSVQYLAWLGDVARGDLSRSLQSGLSVTSLIADRAPATLHLVVGALFISIAVGLPLGVFAARRAGRRADRVVSSLATMGIAVPGFWLAMMLVATFALRVEWFPAIGYVGITGGLGRSLRSLVLPCIALGAAGAAEVARQVRSAMIDALSSDAVRTHRAKGMAERRIVGLHALRNAGVPIMTVFGLLVTRMLGATVVVEAVFGINGLGSLVVSAITQRDYPVIQGVVLFMALLVIAVNLIVDISYRIIDPRTR